MSCLYCCCCTILVLINIIYLLIGVVILALGIILNFFAPVVNQYVVPILNNVIGPILQKAGLNFDINNLITSVIGYLSAIAIGLIIIGAILVVISILGMCSVCCKSRVTIIIYLSILSIIVLVQIIVLIIYATNPKMIQSGISNIFETMIARYEGLNTNKTESVLIDVIHISYGCCGANNYLDFSKSVNWQRNISAVYKYGNTSYTLNGYLNFPLSCCKFVNFVPVNLVGCAVSNDTTMSNMNTGCVSKLFNDIQSYIQLAFKVVGGIIGYQLLIIVAAVICLISVTQDIKPV